jgi:hypothetical protein
LASHAQCCSWQLSAWANPTRSTGRDLSRDATRRRGSAVVRRRVRRRLTGEANRTTRISECHKNRPGVPTGGNNRGFCKAPSPDCQQIFGFIFEDSENVGKTLIGRADDGILSVSVTLAGNTPKGQRGGPAYEIELAQTVAICVSWVHSTREQAGPEDACLGLLASIVSTRNLSNYTDDDHPGFVVSRWQT